MAEPTIEVVPDADAIAQACARRIMLMADGVIAAGGRFSLALSGGSTPKTLYKLLATPAYSKRIDWKKWDIYFGDERCVPPVHPDSNYRMARESLLDYVPIAAEHVYRMMGEIEPQAAAKEYGQMLKENFGDGGLNVVLLGMGDDGHTASLFPQTAALDETNHRCVANYVEKLGMWRITLTAPFINRAKLVLVMVSGAAKARRVDEVLQGPRDPRNLPIQMIQPVDGEMAWVMDAGAAGMVEE
jgi:6-phosphogluconolactonase